MADNTILPGGYGEFFGPDAGLNRDEAYDTRRRLDVPRNGWFLSTVGENIYTHQDLVGVTTVASQLSFFYIPDRMRRVLLREARINVLTADPASTVRTAIYLYDNYERQRRLVKIPASEVVFDSSTTGLKKITLARDIDIPTEAKLFLARWGSSAAAALEGYQSGAGVAPRVLQQRIIAGVVPPFASSYDFNQIARTNSAEDTPLIAYLSPDAVQVF